MNTEEKIMLHIILPMSEISHDIRLSVDLKVSDVVPTLLAILKNLYPNELVLSAAPLLYKSVSGEILSPSDASLKELGLKDADILYLI